MNNAQESCQQQQFHFQSCQRLFFFFDLTFTTFSFLSLSSLCWGGGGWSSRAVNAPRSATEGGTKRGYIVPPHRVPLWLSAPSACAAHLLPQDTSGKERGGRWGFEIQPDFPLSDLKALQMLLLRPSCGFSVPMDDKSETAVIKTHRLLWAVIFSQRILK